MYSDASHSSSTSPPPSLLARLSPASPTKQTQNRLPPDDPTHLRRLRGESNRGGKPTASIDIIGPPLAAAGPAPSRQRKSSYPFSTSPSSPPQYRHAPQHSTGPLPPDIATSRWATSPSTSPSKPSIPASPTRKPPPSTRVSTLLSPTSSVFVATSSQIHQNAFAAEPSSSDAVHQIDAMLAKLRTGGAVGVKSLPATVEPEVAQKPVVVEKYQAIGGRSRWDTAGLEEDAKKAAEEAKMAAERNAPADTEVRFHSFECDFKVELMSDHPNLCTTMVCPQPPTANPDLSPSNPTITSFAKIAPPLAPLSVPPTVEHLSLTASETSPLSIATLAPSPVLIAPASSPKQHASTTLDFRAPSLVASPPKTSANLAVVCKHSEPKHINWADDEEDDSLPPLDDWVIPGQPPPDLSPSSHRPYSGPTSPNPARSISSPPLSPSESSSSRFHSHSREPPPHAMSTPGRGSRRGKSRKSASPSPSPQAQTSNNNRGGGGGGNRG
ncbi:hypothetical protein P7C70_g5547, partial [Phenoliferia sp. Uapishka_3]